MAKQEGGAVAEGAEFRVVYMEPGRLTPHPLNPKTHPDKQKAALAESLEDFGWLAAPIFNQRSGRLVDGHARVEQALVRGEARIPVRVIDVDEATERRILAAFDRIGELRGYDDNVLARLLRDCAEEGGSLPGWSDDDISDLLLKTAPRADAVREAAGEAGEAEREAVDAAGAEAADEPGAPPPAHVRMVQLFYDGDGHAQFERMVAALAERWELKTPSDVVLAALDAALEHTDEKAGG